MKWIILSSALFALALANTKGGFFRQEYQYQQSSSSYKNNELQHKNEEEGYYSRHGDGESRPKVSSYQQQVEYTNPALKGHGQGQQHFGWDNNNQYGVGGGSRLSSFAENQHNQRYGSGSGGGYGHGHGVESRFDEYSSGSSFSQQNSYRSQNANLNAMSQRLQDELEARLRNAVSQQYSSYRQQYSQYNSARAEEDFELLKEELKRNLTEQFQRELHNTYGTQGKRGDFTYSISATGDFARQPNYETRDANMLQQQLEERLNQRLREIYNTKYVSSGSSSSSSHTSSWGGGNTGGEVETFTPNPVYPRPVPVPGHVHGRYPIHGGSGSSSSSSHREQQITVRPSIPLNQVVHRVQIDLDNILNDVLYQANHQRDQYTTYEALLTRLTNDLKRNITYRIDDELMNNYGTQQQIGEYLFSTNRYPVANYKIDELNDLRRQIESNLLEKLRNSLKRTVTYSHTSSTSSSSSSSHSHIHGGGSGGGYKQPMKLLPLTDVKYNLQNELERYLEDALYNEKIYYSSQRRTPDFNSILRNLENDLRRNLTTAFDKESRRMRTHTSSSYYQDGVYHSQQYTQDDLDNLRRELEASLLRKLSDKIRIQQTEYYNEYNNNRGSSHVDNEYQETHHINKVIGGTQQPDYGHGGSTHGSSHGNSHITTKVYYRPGNVRVIPIGSNRFQIEGSTIVTNSSDLAEVLRILTDEMNQQLETAINKQGHYSSGDLKYRLQLLDEELKRNLTAKLNEVLEQKYGSQSHKGGYSYSVSTSGSYYPKANYNQQQLDELVQTLQGNLQRQLQEGVQYTRQHSSSSSSHSSSSSSSNSRPLDRYYNQPGYNNQNSFRTYGFDVGQNEEDCDEMQNDAPAVQEEEMMQGDAPAADDDDQMQGDSPYSVKTSSVRFHSSSSSSKNEKIIDDGTGQPISTYQMSHFSKPVDVNVDDASSSTGGKRITTYQMSHFSKPVDVNVDDASLSTGGKRITTYQMTHSASQPLDETLLTADKNKPTSGGNGKVYTSYTHHTFGTSGNKPMHPPHHPHFSHHHHQRGHGHGNAGLGLGLGKTFHQEVHTSGQEGFGLGHGHGHGKVGLGLGLGKTFHQEVHTSGQEGFGLGHGHGRNHFGHRHGHGHGHRRGHGHHKVIGIGAGQKQVGDDSSEEYEESQEINLGGKTVVGGKQIEQTEIHGQKQEGLQIGQMHHIIKFDKNQFPSGEDNTEHIGQKQEKLGIQVVDGTGTGTTGQGKVTKITRTYVIRNGVRVPVDSNDDLTGQIQEGFGDLEPGTTGQGKITKISRTYVIRNGVRVPVDGSDHKITVTGQKQEDFGQSQLETDEDYIEHNGQKQEDFGKLEIGQKQVDVDSSEFRHGGQRQMIRKVTTVQHHQTGQKTLNFGQEQSQLETDEDYIEHDGQKQEDFGKLEIGQKRVDVDDGFGPTGTGGSGHRQLSIAEQIMRSTYNKQQRTNGQVNQKQIDDDQGQKQEDFGKLEIGQQEIGGSQRTIRKKITTTTYTIGPNGQRIYGSGKLELDGQKQVDQEEDDDVDVLHQGQKQVDIDDDEFEHQGQKQEDFGKLEIGQPEDVSQRIFRKKVTTTHTTYTTGQKQIDQEEDDDDDVLHQGQKQEDFGKLEIGQQKLHPSRTLPLEDTINIPDHQGQKQEDFGKLEIGQQKLHPSRTFPLTINIPDHQGQKQEDFGKLEIGQQKIEPDTLPLKTTLDISDHQGQKPEDFGKIEFGTTGPSGKINIAEHIMRSTYNKQQKINGAEKIEVGQKQVNEDDIDHSEQKPDTDFDTETVTSTTGQRTITHKKTIRTYTITSDGKRKLVDNDLQGQNQEDLDDFETETTGDGNVIRKKITKTYTITSDGKRKLADIDLDLESGTGTGTTGQGKVTKITRTYVIRNGVRVPVDSDNDLTGQIQEGFDDLEPGTTGHGKVTKITRTRTYVIRNGVRVPVDSDVDLQGQKQEDFDDLETGTGTGQQTITHKKIVRTWKIGPNGERIYDDNQGQKQEDFDDLETVTGTGQQTITHKKIVRTWTIGPNGERIYNDNQGQKQEDFDDLETGTTGQGKVTKVTRTYVIRNGIRVPVDSDSDLQGQKQEDFDDLETGTGTGKQTITHKKIVRTWTIGPNGERIYDDNQGQKQEDFDDIETITGTGQQTITHKKIVRTWKIGPNGERIYDDNQGQKQEDFDDIETGTTGQGKVTKVTRTYVLRNGIRVPVDSDVDLQGQKQEDFDDLETGTGTGQQTITHKKIVRTWTIGPNGERIYNDNQGQKQEDFDLGFETSTGTGTGQGQETITHKKIVRTWTIGPNGERIYNDNQGQKQEDFDLGFETGTTGQGKVTHNQITRTYVIRNGVRVPVDNDFDLQGQKQEDFDLTSGTATGTGQGGTVSQRQITRTYVLGQNGGQRSSYISGHKRNDFDSQKPVEETFGKIEIGQQQTGFGHGKQERDDTNKFIGQEISHQETYSHGQKPGSTIRFATQINQKPVTTGYATTFVQKPISGAYATQTIHGKSSSIDSSEEDTQQQVVDAHFPTLISGKLEKGSLDENSQHQINLGGSVTGGYRTQTTYHTSGTRQSSYSSSSSSTYSKTEQPDSSEEAETEQPGFWSKVGGKITNAYSSVKDKTKSYFSKDKTEE